MRHSLLRFLHKRDREKREREREREKREREREKAWINRTHIQNHADIAGLPGWNM
jgi:hypothetical protein